MTIVCTGIILAGGQNRRFGGTNKALLPIGGKPILDHIHDIFKELFDQIILVTNDPVQYLKWDLNIVRDLYPFRSSLTGIHAGLFFTDTPYAFVTACDTPFVKQQLVQALVDQIDSSMDVIVPETSDGLQPLCAVYSRHCLTPISRHLEKQEFKIKRVFKKLRTKTLSEKMLRRYDSNLASFYNINTPEDLAKAQALSVGAGF